MIKLCTTCNFCKEIRDTWLRKDHSSEDERKGYVKFRREDVREIK